MDAKNKDYESDLNVESKFEISGTTTPSGARYIPHILEADEELRVSYTWGERGVTSENMVKSEAGSYLNGLLGRGGYQPIEKIEESHYWTKAPADATNDLNETSLPNPEYLKADGDIDVHISYENGFMGLKIELDTEYAHEIADEDISKGKFKLSYSEKFAEDADNELERTRASLDQFDKVEHLLE